MSVSRVNYPGVSVASRELSGCQGCLGLAQLSSLFEGDPVARHLSWAWLPSWTVALFSVPPSLCLRIFCHRAGDSSCVGSQGTGAFTEVHSS